MMKYYLYLAVSLLSFSMLHANDGIKAFEKGDLETAHQAFLQQLDTASKPEDNEQALLYLARIAIQRNQLVDAEKYIQQSFRILPNGADEHYLNGLLNSSRSANASVFFAGSFGKKARESFTKALELKPKHLDSLKGLAQFYIQAPAISGGSKTKAIETIKQVKDISPIEADLLELELIRLEREPSQLLAKAKDISEKYPNSPTALFNAGMIFQSQESYPLAFSAFNLASAIPVKQYSEIDMIYGALYQVGRTALFSGENLEQGINALKKYLTLEITSNLPSKQWATFRLSGLHNKKGEKESAKKLLNQLRKSDISDQNLKREVKQAYAQY